MVGEHPHASPHSMAHACPEAYRGSERKPLSWCRQAGACSLGKRHSATLRASVCVWAAVTLLGGIIELLQETMQLGRTFEWCDILADSAGALAGAAAAMIIFRQPSE